MSDQFERSVKNNTISYRRFFKIFNWLTPNAITFLRLLILPPLIWSFNHGITFAVYALFLFSIVSDLADGFIARKTGGSSRFGANLDTTVDFVFISGMYLTFVLEGIYSEWILLLIVLAFMQFIVTNLLLKKTFYDLIGKYYGSLLFGGIGLTLLFPSQPMSLFVTVGIIVSTIATLLNRLAFFWKKRT